jgi:hypothetical protein
MNDLDARAAIYSDADVRKYFPEGVLTYDQTKEELEWIINDYYGQYGFMSTRCLQQRAPSRLPIVGSITLCG